MLVTCTTCKSPVFVSSAAAAKGDVRIACATCGTRLQIDSNGTVRVNAVPQPGLPELPSYAGGAADPRAGPETSPATATSPDPPVPARPAAPAVEAGSGPAAGPAPRVRPEAATAPVIDASELSSPRAYEALFAMYETRARAASLDEPVVPELEPEPIPQPPPGQAPVRPKRPAAVERSRRGKDDTTNPRREPEAREAHPASRVLEPPEELLALVSAPAESPARPISPPVVVAPPPEPAPGPPLEIVPATSPRPSSRPPAAETSPRAQARVQGQGKAETVGAPPPARDPAGAPGESSNRLPPARPGAPPAPPAEAGREPTPPVELAADTRVPPHAQAPEPPGAWPPPPRLRLRVLAVALGAGALLVALWLALAPGGASSPDLHAQALAHYRKANGLLAENAATQAVVELDAAVHLEPGLGVIYRSLGVAYMQLGDERRAVEAYERFVALEPSHRDADATRRIIDAYRQRPPGPP